MEYRVIFESSNPALLSAFKRTVVGFEPTNFRKNVYTDEKTYTDIPMAALTHTPHEPVAQIWGRLEGALADNGLPALKREDQMNRGVAIAVYTLAP